MESLENQYGYDESLFISDAPDYFHCVICTLVLRDPVQILSCGHKMCAICFEKIKVHATTTNIELRCPIDRNLINLAEVHDDIYLKRVIGSLAVRCHYHSRGCDWTGDLSELHVHIDKCHLNPNKEGIENVFLSTDAFKTLTDRLDHLESSLHSKDNKIIALLTQIDQQQQHMSDEMRLLQQRQQQDMDNIREQNKILVQKISELTEKNTELQQKQSEMADEILVKIASPGNKMAAGKDHESESNDLIRNPGSAPQERAQRKNIEFEHHNGDPSMVKIDNDTYSVQFNGSDATVKATKGVVSRDFKVWFEVKCSHPTAKKKRLSSFVRIGWATTNFLDSGTSGRLGSDLHSYAFSPFHCFRYHSSTLGKWGETLDNNGFVGVAVDMVKREILFSVNGQWTKPNGVAFSDIPLDVDLFPAMSGCNSTLQWNFGDQNFTYGPPDPTFVALIDAI